MRFGGKEKCLIFWLKYKIFQGVPANAPADASTVLSSDIETNFQRYLYWYYMRTEGKVL